MFLNPTLESYTPTKSVERIAVDLHARASATDLSGTVMVLDGSMSHGFLSDYGGPKK